MAWRCCRGAKAPPPCAPAPPSPAPSIPASHSLDDEALLERLDEWLPPLVTGKRGLTQVDPAALRSALEGLLGYEALRTIDRLAPAEFASPAGSRHAIDYAAPGGPTVEVRAQALYGLSEHPTVAGGRVAHAALDSRTQCQLDYN